MGRVHLDVEFPFEKTRPNVMRFDKKAKKKDILEQLSIEYDNQSLKDASLIIYKSVTCKVWIGDDDTLKSLGVENDMLLLVFMNPSKLSFEFNSKMYTTSFSPHQTVNDIIGNAAECVSLIYYLGYSLFPIYNNEVIYISEDAPLCFQVRNFDKIVFKIKYYTYLSVDTREGIPLSRTYALTRDYIMSGLSPLYRKDYISLCAKIAVIESGDDLNELLLSFKSSHFVRYLPEKLKFDKNAEDNLFDQIKLLEPKEINQMRVELIGTARCAPTFGYQSFDVSYSYDGGSIQPIYLCIGYNGILFAKKNDLSIIDHIDLLGISCEIDIEGIDKYIINDVHQIITSSQNIVDIDSLIKGNISLHKKLETFNSTDSKLESLVYNHNLENDLKLIQKIAPPLFSIASQSKNFIIASRLMDRSITFFNDSSIAAIGYLYFVYSNIIPDFEDCSFSANFNKSQIKEKGNSLMITLSTISKEMRSMNTSFFDLEQKYGNDLRSVVYFVYLMRKFGIDSETCDEIMFIYKQLSLELKIEVATGKTKGFYGYSKFLFNAPFIFPKTLIENALEVIDLIICEIKSKKPKACLNANHENQIQNKETLYANLYQLLYEIKEKFNGLQQEIENTEEILEIKYFEHFEQFSNVLERISFFIPIIALVNPYISRYLSTLYMDFDNLFSMSMIFNKNPTSLCDLTDTLGSIIKDSVKFFRKDCDSNKKKQLSFIDEILIRLQSDIPLFSTKFIKKSTLIDLQKNLCIYYNNLFVLKEDQNDEYLVHFWILCNSILLCYWKIKMIPKSLIYEKEEELENKKNPKKIHSKPHEIKLKKEIDIDDTMEITKDTIQRLSLNPSDTIDASINLNDYIDEIYKIDSTIPSLYNFLMKWKSKLEVANPADKLFDISQLNYNIALNLFSAISDKQNRFQLPETLLLKIQYHLKNVSISEIEEYKEPIMNISTKDIELESKENLKLLQGLLDAILNKKGNSSVDIDSLVILLQKLINYLSTFKQSSFSIDQIIDSLSKAEEAGQEILLKLIHSKYESELSSIIMTLQNRLLELKKVKTNILRKTLNKKNLQSLSKKTCRIKRSLLGLPLYFSKNLMKEDGKKLFISLANCCWQLSNAQVEENHHSRISILYNKGSILMKELSVKLQEQILTIHSIPEEMISFLLLQSKDLHNYKSSKDVCRLLFQMKEIYSKQEFWDVVSIFQPLLNILELIVCRLIKKPFTYVFIEQDSIPQSNTKLVMDPMQFSDSYDSSSDSITNNEFIAPQRRKKISQGLSFHGLSLGLNTKGYFRLSQSFSNFSLTKRQGILIDQNYTYFLKSKPPHVTFDLSKDKNEQIFSDNIPKVIDETVPKAMAPIFPKKKPNFLSWNLPLFMHKLNIPLQVPVYRKKETRKKKVRGISKTESFSNMTFDSLKLCKYCDFEMGFNYSSSKNAEEDINNLIAQTAESLQQYDTISSFSVCERFFYLIDWIPTMNSILVKAPAARKFNLNDQVQELINNYNQFKNILDELIDSLNINQFHVSSTTSSYLMTLFSMIQYALQKAEIELNEIDLKLKETATNWLLYTDEVIQTLQEIIDVKDPLIFICAKAFLETVFNAYVKFGYFADDVDKATNRSINKILQCQLCIQLRTTILNIKNMDLKENPTFSQILNDVRQLRASFYQAKSLHESQNLLQNTQTDKRSSKNAEKLEPLIDSSQKNSNNKNDEFLELLAEIEKSLQSNKMLFTEADRYSLNLRRLINSCCLSDKTSLIDDAVKEYYINEESPIVDACLKTISISYNILYLRFTNPTTTKTPFASSLTNLMTNFDQLSNSFNNEAKTIMQRNIAQKWTSFFSSVKEELEELITVSAIMTNSSRRLSVALKYLKKVAAEIIKIENSDFTFKNIQAYRPVSTNLLDAIDYILDNIDTNDPIEENYFITNSQHTKKEIEKLADDKNSLLGYDTVIINKLHTIKIKSVSKVPTVKVTMFTKLYQSYEEKSTEIRKAEGKISFIIDLLLCQLKLFSQKFKGSYSSIINSINLISDSMIKLISLLDSNIELTELEKNVKSMKSEFDAFQLDDLSPVSSAGVLILQKTAKVGELVVALILFNLDFFLSKTSNSKDIIKLLKANGIIKENEKKSYIFIRNDESFYNSYNIITSQLKIFEEIKSKIKVISNPKNPFEFSTKEMNKIDEIKKSYSNGITQLLEKTKTQFSSLESIKNIQLIFKLHKYLSKTFDSLFIYTSKSSFIKSLQKFVNEFLLYSTYYQYQSNEILKYNANKIQKYILATISNFNNKAKFRQYYFMVKHFNAILKEQIHDVITIEKGKTKSKRIEKILSLYERISGILENKKTVPLFHNFLGIIQSLQTMSRLKLRITYGYSDLIDFILSVQNIIELPNEFREENLKMLLSIISKDSYRISDELFSNIANMLSG